MSCGRRLAPDQWWGFCGETDMGQTLPALCTECGGEYKLKEAPPKPGGPHPDELARLKRKGLNSEYGEDFEKGQIPPKPTPPPNIIFKETDILPDPPTCDHKVSKWTQEWVCKCGKVME